MPSHGVGVISFWALVARRLRPSPATRVAYVVSAVLALYLNVFVLVVQAFRKLPSLNALTTAIDAR